MLCHSSPIADRWFHRFQTETWTYFPGRFYSKLGKFLSVSISISRTTIRRSRFLLFLLNDPATWEGRRVNIRVRAVHLIEKLCGATEGWEFSSRLIFFLNFFHVWNFLASASIFFRVNFFFHLIPIFTSLSPPPPRWSIPKGARHGFNTLTIFCISLKWFWYISPNRCVCDLSLVFFGL